MENNKKNEFVGKITIIVLIIVIVAIIAAIVIKGVSNSKKVDDGGEEISNDSTIYNESKEVVEDKDVDGIKFTNIKCYWTGEDSVISYTITNNSDNVFEVGVYTINVYDDNGELLYGLRPYLGESLESGETKDEIISTSENLSDAKKIEIKLEDEYGKTISENTEVIDKNENGE